MAIYQYGEITVPEIRVFDDTPYVQIYKETDDTWIAFYSSKPFVAMDIYAGNQSSLVGNSGFVTMAVTPNTATTYKYKFVTTDTKGWVGWSGVIIQVDNEGLNKGGESGVVYYLAGSLKKTTWLNQDVTYLPSTVVYQTPGDPVLVKESFPIQDFTSYLMTGWQSTKSFPMPGSGGDS